MFLHSPSLSLSPASTDYITENITEIRFRGGMNQDVNGDPLPGVGDPFPITINADDDESEHLEVFYLIVVAILNAIVLTPRIKVEICSDDGT